MFARARTTLCRWSTRGVRPRSALAKAPCACGAVRVFFLCPLVQARRMRKSAWSMSVRWECLAALPPTGTRKSALRLRRGTCLFPMPARASTARGWDVCPVEHAERAPPMGTRKNALRRWRCSVFFLMPALVQARRGVGMFARWSTRSVRPRSALAKTPCADGAARSFFLCLRPCRHGAGLGCLPGGARGACAPVRHSQKQPCYAQPLFHLCSLFYACGVGGVGMIPPRWSTRGVRPRSALAKAAVLRTVSFSFVPTLLRLRRRQCAQMKNSP